VKEAWTRDPVPRLRTWLAAQGLWDESTEQQWIAECTRLVDVEIDAYLGTKTQPPESMFDYLYADPPPDILEQRAQLLALEGRAGGRSRTSMRRPPPVRQTPRRSPGSRRSPRPWPGRCATTNRWWYWARPWA